MHTVYMSRSEGSSQESAVYHVHPGSSSGRWSWWKVSSATETVTQVLPAFFSSSNFVLGDLRVSCVSSPPTWRWDLLWYPFYRGRVTQCPSLPFRRHFWPGSAEHSCSEMLVTNKYDPCRAMSPYGLASPQCEPFVLEVPVLGSGSLLLPSPSVS